MRLFCLLAALVLGGLGAAQAHTVTLEFDGTPDGIGGCPVDQIFEQGITISGTPCTFDAPAGEIHLDDGGSPLEGIVSFTGKIFDAHSITIKELPSCFGFGDCFDEDFEPLPYTNVIFRGFLDGLEVASQGHSTLGLGIHDVLFDPDFVGLDRLDILQVMDSAEDRARYPGAFCTSAPCAHVALDRLTLKNVAPAAPAPVPLPGSMVLALGALGALLVLGRRRRT